MLQVADRVVLHLPLHGVEFRFPVVAHPFVKRLVHGVQAVDFVTESGEPHLVLFQPRAPTVVSVRFHLLLLEGDDQIGNLLLEFREVRFVATGRIYQVQLPFAVIITIKLGMSHKVLDVVQAGVQLPHSARHFFVAPDHAFIVEALQSFDVQTESLRRLRLLVTDHPARREGRLMLLGEVSELLPEVFLHLLTKLPKSSIDPVHTADLRMRLLCQNAHRAADFGNFAVQLGLCCLLLCQLLVHTLHGNLAQPLRLFERREGTVPDACELCVHPRLDVLELALDHAADFTLGRLY
mmetsp:Transcript_120930/g.342051  ORF Transcript_120930/g.342051 Transcript_120930/m.342051 type:complete len:294 (+) Transcript_120930:486-1367(+)